MRWAVALLLMILHLVGPAGLAASSSPDPFRALGLIRFESGIKAPDFTLPDLNGNTVSITSPSGPATLLVFWGTW